MEKGKVKDMTKFNSLSANDRMIAKDSYAHLEQALEKLDPKILEPLSSTLWPRDMPVITGGGMVENVATISVEYASTGKEEDNLIWNNTNDIPTIQADLGKDVSRTFIFSEYMNISYIDREKFLKTINGRSLEEILNKGVHLHFDKFCDRNVYLGFTKVHSTGLLNNPKVNRVTAVPHTTGGTDTTWEEKNADEILADINNALTRVWAACDMSPDALPNHLLIPIKQFGQLVNRKVSEDSERSILTYVMENNLTNSQGGNLVISPCKYCEGAGAGGTDRMVVYMNDVDKIRFHQTVNLHRLETEIASLTFKTPYIAQISEVEFNYLDTVLYYDGI